LDAVRALTGGFVSFIEYLIECSLFVPFDLLTVPVRDVVLPRRLKAWCPPLSCRKYDGYNKAVLCRPVRKYWHADVFRLAICRRCGVGPRAGECHHPLRGGERHSEDRD
jgi:hypothetical protein